MIVCITDKHAMLTTVCQLAAQLLCIINHSDLSKNVERVKKYWILLVELAEWWILVDFGSEILHLRRCLGAFGPDALAQVFMLASESSQV